MNIPKFALYGAVALIAIVFVYFVVYNRPGTLDNVVIPSVSENPIPNITVKNPRAGETVSNPLMVVGRARVFENQLNWRLLDDRGTVLAQGGMMANAPDMGQFGDFAMKILLPLATTDTFTLEVLDYSAKDGSPIDVVALPLKLASRATGTVNVYFNNSTLDPEVSCTKVFPVKRTVLKTQETAFAALAELLHGPTVAETGQKYSTSIPTGVGINSVKIMNGTAYVDFDGRLEDQMGGSCRVSAVRAQITETLKQYPSIKDVVISVYGRTEDILQP